MKLYVSLKKHQDDQGDYKKLILMTSENSWIYELKRKIEREFSELFPPLRSPGRLLARGLIREGD